MDDETLLLSICPLSLMFFVFDIRQESKSQLFDDLLFSVIQVFIFK